MTIIKETQMTLLQIEYPMAPGELQKVYDYMSETFDHWAIDFCGAKLLPYEPGEPIQCSSDTGLIDARCWNDN